MLIAGALVAIGWNSGRDESVLPPCPTHEYLGFYCPGCGSTRGIACLLRGDLAGAWRFNPGMVVLGAPALLVGV
ncbi:MAG TPA: DUF2752 domain-containing protein, partial [Phycisphaerales bacterium]|nr:DUF2752 domain-containing protein [Phycisphaerales bacterium]